MSYHGLKNQAVEWPRESPLNDNREGKPTGQWLKTNRNHLTKRKCKLLKEMTIRTSRRNELIDITSEIRSLITESGIDEGVCNIFVPHTTAAVTINEKADPAVARDIANDLERLVPNSPDFTHAEGNSDSHVKTTLAGASEFLIISGGEPVLGIWQAVFFCEFDGPRTRRYLARISGS
jgi:secondary thiamine-phosphate synthase enzyme